MRQIVLVGTNTAIGKTWVGCALAIHLRTAGLHVVARKPVQSYTPSVDVLDSTLLAEATGEASESVCPTQWSFPIAMAPPLAAEALGLASPSIDELRIFANVVPADADFCLLELVGGVRSPIAKDGDSVDLARNLHPDLVVLVSDSELGAINAVRLSLESLGDLHVVTFLNRYDESNAVHQTNEWFMSGHGIRTVTSVPKLAEIVMGV